MNLGRREYKEIISWKTPRNSSGLWLCGILQQLRLLWVLASKWFINEKILPRIFCYPGIDKREEYNCKSWNFLTLCRIAEVYLFLLQNGSCCGGKANGPGCCMNEKEDNMVRCSLKYFLSPGVLEPNSASLCTKVHSL